ncbi:MAG: type II asparaginase [Pseudomonadales bacterium]|jgi:L-asparaginase|nr:type II asparaginase [Pseudomonadales bacterium]
MRSLRHRALTVLLSVFLAPPLASSAEQPSVVILATGGTIAGAAETRTQAGYSSGQLGVDALLAAVPGLGELAELSGEQLSNVGSQDMSDAIWLRLAARVNELLARRDVDGVVITHGTDTLEETAYFLNLTVHSRKPVVLTAAMRPATAVSADGPLNLYNAVAVAADPEAAGRGVMVVVNDDVLGARAFTKTHTTDLQTFSAGEAGLLGATLYGENRWFRTPWRTHTEESPFSVKGAESLPRVDVLYMTADASADLVNAAVEAGARGLVIAGVGNGNMPAPVLEAVQRAVAEGVVVVRASRVTGGFVGRNVEVDDDALGTVAAGELNPPRARVLLKLALRETRDAARIQTYFFNH